MKPSRSAPSRHSEKFRSDGRASTTSDHRWIDPLFMLAIAVLVFIVFIPALRNQFLHWDDEDNFLSNDHWRGLGAAQLAWMFTAFHMGHYQPVAWLTLGFDHVWSGWVYGVNSTYGQGMDPRAYHLTNIIIHSANAALVYLVAASLLGLGCNRDRRHRTWPIRVGSVGVALIFGVHPMRVESVAWITERRDLVSAFMLLITVLLYLRANDLHIAGQQRYHRRWMALTLVVYTISLMGKVSGVPFVAVMLVLDWYPLRRFSGSPPTWFSPPTRNVWLEKIPFVIVAGVFAAIAVVGQARGQTLVPLADYPLDGRIVQSFYGLVFYAWKTVWPLHLMPIYELRLPVHPLDRQFVVAGAVALIATTALFALRSSAPSVVAAFLCYAFMLGPVLGVFQNGPQIVADRYSYLPSVGLLIVAAAGLIKWWRRGSSAALAVALVLFASAVSVTFGVMTWRQCQVWRDNQSFWGFMIEHDPAGVYANNGYGWTLKSAGHVEESIPYFRQAIVARPDFAPAYNNLGNALLALNRIDEAIEQFTQSAKYNPRAWRIHTLLGAALFQRGRLDEAGREYLEAARINPNAVEPHVGLGLLYMSQQKFGDAIPHLQEALRIDPGHVKARELLAAAQQHKNAPSN